MAWILVEKNDQRTCDPNIYDLRIFYCLVQHDRKFQINNWFSHTRIISRMVANNKFQKVRITMENFFMGVVSIYFIFKIMLFMIFKIDKIERNIAKFKEWDWIDKDDIL